MIEQSKIQAFREDGYIVFPDAIPPAFLQKLRRLFEEEMSKPKDMEGIAFHSQNGKEYITALPFLCRMGDLTCLELLGSPLILNMAESICGPDFFLLQEFAVIKHLGDNQEVLWHLDVPNQRTGSCFTMGIYLDDADENDGALRLVPESHLSSKDICELQQEASIAVPVKAGGIMIHDMMLAHSSGPLRFNPIRRVLYFEFMSAAQALRESQYTEEQLNNRMRLIQLAIALYNRRHPGEPAFPWSNPFNLEAVQDDSIQESLESLYNVKTFGKPSAYCFR